MFTLNNHRIFIQFYRDYIMETRGMVKHESRFSFFKVSISSWAYNLQIPIQERNNLKAERIKLVTKTSFFLFYETFQSNKCVSLVFSWITSMIFVRLEIKLIVYFYSNQPYLIWNLNFLETKFKEVICMILFLLSIIGLKLSFPRQATLLLRK